MIEFHRKEQFDILKGGIKNPLVVVGWKTPDSYSRLFCLWSGGVWLRLWGKKRLCLQWSKSQLTPRAADVCPVCHGTGYKRISPTMLADCRECNSTGQRG